MKWRLVILDYAQTLSLLQALKDGGKSGTQDARELEEHARDLQRDYPRLGTPEKFQGLVPAQGPG